VNKQETSSLLIRVQLRPVFGLQPSARFIFSTACSTCTPSRLPCSYWFNRL